MVTEGLSIEQLKRISEYLRETDLKEVVFEDESVRFHVKRSTGFKASAQMVDQSIEEVAEPETKKTLYIYSDMVGSFHRGDAPDRPPMVVEGTNIEAGQAVGTVEAMKIVKDVISPMACQIVKCLVSDGAPVEYGQALYEVEPLSQG